MTVLRNVGSFISHEEDDCVKKWRQLYFSGLQVIRVSKLQLSLSFCGEELPANREK